MELVQEQFDEPKYKYKTQIASIGLRRMVLISIPGFTDPEIFHQKVLAMKKCMLKNQHPGNIFE